MANSHGSTHNSGNHESPKMYIIGYLLSIILTIAALWLTVANVLTVGVLVLIIVLLAGLQILVQLFFFMHITEKGDGPAYHIMGLVLGLIFVFVIVGGSIWIMSFNSMVS